MAFAIVFGIGRLFGLGPIGLIKLAAFFATLKLAVAGICAFTLLTCRCFCADSPIPKFWKRVILVV